MWSHQEMNSIFYVDSDYESLSFNKSKMETEVRTLKQELSRTRDALKLATKRCRDLVRELDSRIVGHESERCLRDQQLSRILRALLVLESRLKQEQKSIRQLLSEKDNVIRNQQLEIAKLRRYTKNYIKSKREQNRNTEKNIVKVGNLLSNNLDDDICLDTSIMNNRVSRIDEDDNIDEISNELGNDIQRLKREIIDKLSTTNKREINVDKRENGNDDNNQAGKVSNCFVRKTNSFAGSDVSKESCASSSENTDAGSILTTTTDESSPSLLSTEGFCEGESTDCSPGSTLNKSSSKSFGLGIPRRIDENDPRMVTTTTRMIMNVIRDRDDDDDDDDDDDSNKYSKRRNGVVRVEPLEIFFNDERETKVTIPRTESKDDGMDCNFASDDENLDDMHEPIYVNACKENNARNLQESRSKIEEITTENNEREYHFDNNNGPSKLQLEEPNVEETSGNWYSDPDEDRINDDVFRHSTYRPNGNHNSVLECVNQILLRDMEEEDSILTAPRRFKHRGRIVRFQPARLSDIESVGSEMERRNSEECTNESESGNFEATASEDEFGMRIDQDCDPRPETNSVESETSSNDNLNVESAAAIPIIVIEPKTESNEAARRVSTSCLEIVNQRSRPINRSASPTLRMERIEEKTCLQMSSKGLTIAKNLDYEDIESLPEIISPMPKTPPALPPKPTQFRNTLVLKKIPSPSFLIDETGRKHPQKKFQADTTRVSRVISCISSPTKIVPNGSSARSLVFEEKYSTKSNENDFVDKNRFTSKKSPLQSVNESSRNRNGENCTPRVTNMVRHFEEFKIGSENEERNFSRELGRSKERRALVEFDDFDIRQNFEEFNLDECDLSDDPDRPDGDGSERLTNSRIRQTGSENANVDNNNIIYNSSSNSIGTTSCSTNGIYDNFLEATGLSNKSILTPSRLLSNHKSMLKPKDVKYKNKIKASAVMEKNGLQTTGNNSQFTHVRHWTGPFV